ncbi:MAG: hybrid sensor histidine kinase/response regulator [Desulfobacterales bacterium]|nr:hybrid sensor histidine kinase/response regulator [Desulfobacterales bacterium]
MIDSLTPTILIVDDQSENIWVLTEALKNDYQIVFARSGLKALELAETNLPDIILLDIMMPGLNGYEVCGILKKHVKTQHIPIVFITARDEVEYITKGFELGAVDYITKPFNLSIVRSRIKTHIELKHHRDHLSELVQERTDQLIHKDRLATIGTIATAILHDISSPLTYINGNIEILKFELSDKNAPYIVTKLDKILEGTKQIRQLLDSYLTFSRHDKINKQHILFHDILQNVVNMLHYRLKKEKMHVDVSQVPSDLKIYCDKQKMIQVVINLMNNSIEAKNKEPGLITISASQRDSDIIISVHDNGPGIVDTSSIFKPFFTTKESHHGSGLGLFIVKQIIEMHEGRIEAEVTTENQGARIHMYLPYCL